MLLFLFFIFVTNTFHGIESTQWSCGMSQCMCSNIFTAHTTSDGIASSNINNNGDDTNAAPKETAAVCYLQSLNTYNSISLSLPENLTSLTITCTRENTRNYLPQDMFAGHPRIRNLSLQSCVIGYIDPNFGSGLDKVESINFLENTLPIFSPDTFSSVQSLTSLTIIQSSIDNYPHFQLFRKLEKLDISQNNVKSPDIIVYNDIEHNLYDLVHVNLSYNGIREFTSEFFSITPNLKYFYIEGNKISQLSVPPNTTLSHIEQFTGFDNPLHIIDFESFTSSRNLTQFKITGGSGANSLTFTRKLYLPNLLDFKLSNFGINDSFWNLIEASSLTKLDVSSNRLENINLTTFPRLQKIYLQENNISLLPPETFQHQPNLLVVNISFNHISQIPETLFNRNPQLIALLMKGNNVSVLSSRLFHTTPNVFYLDLSYNVLTRFPFGFFSKVPNLLYLYIQGNLLKFLPDLSKLGQLFHLDISNNRLIFLTGNSFKGLGSMQFLVASNNKLKNIPKGLFTSCPQLLEATFDNNQIKFIRSLESHPRLLKLSFQNNSLTDFPSVSPFSHMQSLAYIFLDNNAFYSITPNMFPASIEAISMTENNIYILLRDSLDNMPRLSFVNFILNRKVINIPQLSVQKYTHESHKPTIYLDFTELGCNCRLGYLKVWHERRQNIRVLKNRFPNFHGLDNAFCDSPLYPGKLITFNDLPLRDFVCEYNETQCFDGVCDCCHSPDLDNCSCVYTCPAECTCFEGGSSFWKDYVHINCKSRNLTYVPDLIPPRANIIYLDGNALTTLKKASMSHLSHAEEIYLNESGIVYLEDGVFDDMNQIEIIHLDRNLMTSISRHTFGNISSLRYLDLSYNKINTIKPGSFNELVGLKTLHLSNNQLTSLDDNVLDLLNLHSLTLAFNPWSCGCDVIDRLSTYLARKRSTTVVKDRGSICCQFDPKHSHEMSFLALKKSSPQPKKDVLNRRSPTKAIEDIIQNDNLTNREISHGEYEMENHSLRKEDVSVLLYNSTAIYSMHNDTVIGVSCFPLVKYDFHRSCAAIVNKTANTLSESSNYLGDIRPAIIVALFITATILVVLVVFVVLFTWRRSELQALLYAKTGVRIWDKKADLDKQEKGTKPFDAFISYSQADNEYVCNTLVPDLEKKRYKVCVHYRDFPVGGNICDVIRRAIQLSSRTILVVSPSFLRSNWCRYEFQTAHHHVLKEGSHRLILVLLEDIPEGDMDPDFRAHMKINTYLKAQDPWFWEKLQFALPNISNRAPNVDGDELNHMRGMMILSKKDDIDNKNNMDEEETGKVVTETIVNGDKKKDNNDNTWSKIDWHKEGERIQNERNNENMLFQKDSAKRSGVEDCQIEFDWSFSVDASYVNKCYDLEEETGEKIYHHIDEELDEEVT